MKTLCDAAGDWYRVFGDDETVLDTCEGCDYVLYTDHTGDTVLICHDDWCPVVHPEQAQPQRVRLAR